MDRERIRRRLKTFLVEIIDAKGPKAVARELTAHGWRYEEGTVRTWRGTKNPPPDVVFALSALYGSSIDSHLLGQPEEERLRDQLAELRDEVHEARLETARVLARLEMHARLTGHWGPLFGPKPAETEAAQEKSAG